MFYSFYALHLFIALFCYFQLKYTLLTGINSSLVQEKLGWQHDKLTMVFTRICRFQEAMWTKFSWSFIGAT